MCRPVLASNAASSGKDHERAMTLLLITHEPELARRCERRLEMADGRLREPVTGRHRVALATDEVA